MSFDSHDMVMKSADLHKLWDLPDNSRLTPKQLSFRLPVHVAAQINALCDIYPHRTKTEIVGDLLAAALAELVPSLPSVRGRIVDRHPDFGIVYELQGAAVEFRSRANKHFKEIEKELGNKAAGDLFAGELTDCDNPPDHL
jgi:hypothetical protein